jgi:hypothetical protein
MKRPDSSEINAYILDEETHFKVNKSHFTLGERKLREMHDRNAARLQKVKDLAASLGVEYTPCLPTAESIIERTELIQKYHENKEFYDNILGQVLSVCTPEEVLQFISEHLNDPK